MGAKTFYEDLETRPTEESREFSKNPIVKWGWIIRVSRTINLVKRLIKQGSKISRVLDIGCAGAWLHNQLLYQEIDHRYIGCDISFTYLSKVKETAESCRVLCDAGALPFRSASAEIVTSFEVIEHLLEPTMASKEMERVAKRSIAVSVPIQGWHLLFLKDRFNRAAEQNEQKIRKYIETVGLEKGLRNLEKKIGAAHINVYTVSRLRNLFASKEYTQEKTQGLFFYLPQMRRILQNSVLRRLYIFFDRILFSRLPLFQIYTWRLPFKTIGNGYGILVLHRKGSKI